MALLVLRCALLMVASGMGIFFIRMGLIPPDVPWAGWLVFGGAMGVAGAIIAAVMLARRKNLDTISAVYFGLVVGLLLAYAVSLALIPVPMTPRFRDATQIVLAVVLSYLCISLLLQTKNDFRFLIPYVEFVKEVKGRKPCVLDTSAIIDGRIADVVDTEIIDTQLVIPGFVIAELQSIADSSDRLRRTRGRRGLDILQRLRGNPRVDLTIYDRELPEQAGQPVDMKLVLLAKHLEGRLITHDYNLNKVARLQGVAVINLNDLANALKPSFLPGEQVEVRLVKTGEAPGQGVGYLDDGTMVVVEGGREHLNELVAISVTSVLQTSAGRMVFGRYESTRPADHPS